MVLIVYVGGNIYNVNTEYVSFIDIYAMSTKHTHEKKIRNNKTFDQNWQRQRGRASERASVEKSKM